MNRKRELLEDIDLQNGVIQNLMLDKLPKMTTEELKDLLDKLVEVTKLLKEKGGDR